MVCNRLLLKATLPPSQSLVNGKGKTSNFRGAGTAGSVVARGFAATKIVKKLFQDRAEQQGRQ